MSYVKYLLLGLLVLILIMVIFYFFWMYILGIIAVGVFLWGGGYIVWVLGNTVGAILFNWEDKL